MAEFTEQTQTHEGRAKPELPLPALHQHPKLAGADPLSLGNARRHQTPPGSAVSPALAKGTSKHSPPAEFQPDPGPKRP